MNQNAPQQQPPLPLSSATPRAPGQINNLQQLHQAVAQHGHIPVWVHPQLAGHILARHGAKGHAIAHPGIPVPMPAPMPMPQQQPQRYAAGGVAAPIQGVGDDPGEGVKYGQPDMPWKNGQQATDASNPLNNPPAGLDRAGLSNFAAANSSGDPASVRVPMPPTIDPSLVGPVNPPQSGEGDLGGIRTDGPPQFSFPPNPSGGGTGGFLPPPPIQGVNDNLDTGMSGMQPMPAIRPQVHPMPPTLDPNGRPLGWHPIGPMPPVRVPPGGGFGGVNSGGGSKWPPPPPVQGFSDGGVIDDDDAPPVEAGVEPTPIPRKPKGKGAKPKPKKKTQGRYVPPSDDDEDETDPDSLRGYESNAGAHRI